MSSLKKSLWNPTSDGDSTTSLHFGIVPFVDGHGKSAQRLKSAAFSPFVRVLSSIIFKP